MVVAVVADHKDFAAAAVVAGYTDLVVVADRTEYMVAVDGWKMKVADMVLVVVDSLAALVHRATDTLVVIVVHWEVCFANTRLAVDLSLDSLE